MPSEIRIWKVTYTSVRRKGFRHRQRTLFTKIPYGGVFAMTELLTRMVSIRQIERFTIAAATAREIEALRWAGSRYEFRRWLPALTENDYTGVDWQA